MENSSFDIIIVGAGTAGATLARMIDSEKYKVLIIDAHDRLPKVCAGLLSTSAQKILARQKTVVPSAVITSPQHSSVRVTDLSDGYTKYYKRGYINTDREKFDEYIRSLIPKTVTTVRGVCNRIVKRTGGYEVALADGSAKFFGKYLVGADGGSSYVRRALFGNEEIFKYTAIQEWYPSFGTEPFYACLFDNETSDGSSWIFFKDELAVFGGAFPRKGSRVAFESQKEKLRGLGILSPESLSSPIRLEACTLSRPRITRGVCLGGDGAFLIGEAAGLITPDSFEGISFALASAEALAEALNKSPKRAHAVYRRKCARLRLKIFIRCIKRPFMYNKTLRRLVMKSGVTAIKK